MNPSLSPADLVCSFESASVAPEFIRDTRSSPDSIIPLNKYFAKNLNNEVKFIGGYMEIYIPMKDVDRGSTIISGKNITTFGIFELRLWDEDQDSADLNNPKYVTRYMYPSLLSSSPSITLKRTMQLTNDDSPQQYMVFGYVKYDTFIKSTVIAKNAVTVQLFTNNIFGAFLSNIVDYDDFATLLLQSSIANGMTFKLNATTMELIFSAQARYAKDITMEYRKFINKLDPATPLKRSDLMMIKVTDIPHIASTFTSVTFQNLDYAVTASSVRNRTGQKQVTSDVEEVIKY